MFVGTSVHKTAQVAGAGLVYDQLWIRDLNADTTVSNVAIVTKLVRNVFMVLVLPIMVYIYNNTYKDEKQEKKKINFFKIFPLFILGFIFMTFMRSLGTRYLFKTIFFRKNQHGENYIPYWLNGLDIYWQLQCQQ